MTHARSALFLAILLGATSCDRGEAGDAPAPAADEAPAQAGDGFLERYGGDPYTGFLEVRIEPPGGKAWTQWGEGSAHFVERGAGRAQLVVFGAIDDEKGDAGFTVDGRYDADGWTSDDGAITVRLGPDGRISGGGSQPPQRFALSGNASDTAFDLDVEVELLEASRNAMPAGTRFHFDYDLSRAEPEPETAAVGDEAGADRRDGGKKGKCRKIRYEMRPVANIGDGSMSMIQVPVCLK